MQFRANKVGEKISNTTKKGIFFSKQIGSKTFVRSRVAKVVDRASITAYKAGNAKEFLRFYWGIERLEKARYRAKTSKNSEIGEQMQKEVRDRASKLSEFYNRQKDGFSNREIIEKKYSRSIIANISGIGAIIGFVGAFVGYKAKFIEPFARDTGKFVSDSLDYIYLGFASPIGTYFGNIAGDVVKYANENVDEILRVGVTSAVVSFVFHVRSRIKIGKFRDGKNALLLLKRDSAVDGKGQA